MALPIDLGIRSGELTSVTRAWEPREENCHCPHGVIICGHLIKNYNVRAWEPVLQYEMVSTYWHCIVYQECKHILFRTLESVVGQCAFYGVPKSRFEAFNNRLWISYPLEVRKRLRTAENGLKSNSVTDHHGVHKRCSMIWQHHIKKNLSVIENKRARRGVASSRSTNLIKIRAWNV